MSSHKQLIASFITGVLAASSVMVANANEEPKYPPMNSSQMGSVPPPPPVYNAPAYQGQAPQYRGTQQRGPQNQAPQYSRPYPQQMGNYGRPAPYGQPMPYAPNGSYGSRPGPYGPSAPYGGNGPRPGQWNNGGFNQGPFNQGPFNQTPWGGNRGFGNNNPMNKMFNSRYGGIWGMRPDEWVKAGPEDGFSYMWDDMINAPSEMGEMPGGYSAPSISVPNPVEIGSEFRKEAPNLAREIPNMINVN